MKRKEPCILYITFIDLYESASSGSSVRPQQMKRAFEELGCKLIILQGLHNRVVERRRHVRETIKQIARGSLTVDFCYIEPPSGPLFCVEDLKLIKVLASRKIPIGLFYRDAYWLTKDSYSSGGAIKSTVIKLLHRRDLRVFNKCCDIIYVPSDSFASFVGFKCKTSALPPACPAITFNQQRSANKIPTAIFVGSATKEYGILLILDAFRQLNANGKVIANLNIVCPESNWSTLPKEYKSLKNEAWLAVYHVKGAENLVPHYARSDFALLPYLQIPYNDMAMPVKLFEYIAYEKPIITTNCTEKALFVDQWGIGLICEDNPQSLAATTQRYLDDSALQESFKRNLVRAHQQNLWTSRAKKVISDLM